MIFSKLWHVDTPLAELVLCPVKVQGEGAAEQVVQAIEWFNRKKGSGCTDCR